MSTIREFYIDKEKRELINTIGSANYVSEEQKEAMIGVLTEDESAELKDEIAALRKKIGVVGRDSEEGKKLWARLEKKLDKIRGLAKNRPKKTDTTGSSISRGSRESGGGHA